MVAQDLPLFVCMALGETGKLQQVMPPQTAISVMQNESLSKEYIAVHECLINRRHKRHLVHIAVLTGEKTCLFLVMKPGCLPSTSLDMDIVTSQTLGKCECFAW